MFPSKLPITLAECGPQGEVGVEQSPNPVAPTTLVMPVIGSMASSLPEKARLNTDLPGPCTNPCPTSGGRPGPIGTNVPLCKSSVPNWRPPVIMYARWLRLADVESSDVLRPHPWIWAWRWNGSTVGSPPDEA